MKKDTALFLIGLTAAAFTGAALYAMAPGKYTEEMAEPLKRKFFAHRGLHDMEKGVPENSLKAFDLAASKGYGMELDVQLSKDREVVVFHDDNLTRVCGTEKMVEDLTLDELKELRLHDTEETIPTFKEVLDLVGGRAPMIVELKPCNNRRTRKVLCSKTLELLKDYEGEYCVESFDPLIVSWFRKNAPHILRGQLAMPTDRYNPRLPWLFRYSMSRCLGNYAASPHFIAYHISGLPLTCRIARAMGALHVVWTSREKGDHGDCDAVIFENYLP